MGILSFFFNSLLVYSSLLVNESNELCNYCTLSCFFFCSLPIKTYFHLRGDNELLVVFEVFLGILADPLHTLQQVLPVL